ncbi:hypothetical protein GH733_002655, partial [Mirounga leonina]
MPRAPAGSCPGSSGPSEERRAKPPRGFQVSGPAAPTRAALPGYESPGPASPPAARTRSRGALSWRGPEILTGFPPCARTEDLSLLQPSPCGYGLCGARGGKREAWMRSLAHSYPTAHLNGQHYSQLLLHPHGRQ